MAKTKKNRPDGSADNPFRLDYFDLSLRDEGITYFEGYVVQMQHRKDGPWLGSGEPCSSEQSALREIDECIKYHNSQDESDWRRRTGNFEGSSVRRVVFNERTTPDELNSMIADVRKAHKNIVDNAKSGAKKKFQPKKYPRFRVVKKRISAAKDEQVLAEKGLQDG